MKKALGVLLGVAVLVALVAWYFVSFKMDATIERTIEKHASASLGTLVSVGSVTSDIKGGSLYISNITIANPPGYKNQNAFSLNDIEAAIGTAREHGFELVGEIINIDDGPNAGRRVAYTRDRDGVTVEFLQAPGGGAA